MIIDKQMHERTTHNIANKGFGGLRRFIARFNFLCARIENRPQSLTGHIVNRYVVVLKCKNDNKFTD